MVSLAIFGRQIVSQPWHCRLSLFSINIFCHFAKLGDTQNKQNSNSLDNAWLFLMSVLIVSDYGLRLIMDDFWLCVWLCVFLYFSAKHQEFFCRNIDPPKLGPPTPLGAQGRVCGSGPLGPQEKVFSPRTLTHFGLSEPFHVGSAFRIWLHVFS